MSVCAARGKKHTIGMPGDRCDGGAQRFLQVLGDPPVVFFFEIANGNDPSAAADCELRLRGTPAYTSRRAVDSQEYERGLPLAGLARLPDVGIPVLATGHDAATVGCDIHAGDSFVMATELVLQAESVAGAMVELNVILTGDG